MMLTICSFKTSVLTRATWHHIPEDSIFEVNVTLQAASTPLQNLQFQSEYTRLRAEFLQCLAQLVHTCHSLCTAPPPAVASAIAETTRDNLQRYGHITNQVWLESLEPLLWTSWLICVMGVFTCPYCWGLQKVCLLYYACGRWDGWCLEICIKLHNRRFTSYEN
jgi:hypothetical protein